MPSFRSAFRLKTSRLLAKGLLVSMALVFAQQPVAQAAETVPAQIHLDYAYYSPVSLVLKHFGWLEQALPQSKVTWVLSQGSNRSLEYLNSGSVDFASSASLSAVLARANGSPIKSVYVYSRAEWTAFVVRKDSPLQTVADLKGKKIAATKGTDPYLFTLRALQQAGLKKDDVELLHLQHPDGRIALEKGDVDAWAGLDPHMAASEIQAGSRLLYRNKDFNSYGVLSVTETYAKEHPEAIKTVLTAYEKAREWAVGHPDELARLLAQESGLPLEVARLQLSRTDLSAPQLSAKDVESSKAAAPILVSEELVRKGVNVEQVVDQLITPDFSASVIARQ
ncbi:aliphatic sulfonate ABC transporter substrate-binding protein [Pseudomonas alliivorans]|uniref:aliphatic sulfonate ABC transporter substrate-binding protein n=1 Tax=Pseudomonas alliivorans TaxID=2810613 RepID=UPI001AE4D44D|nr:aliphatic sulfonate ABC transporter substrate-binding protein [Pseudomonas alliivorans]MBP0941535.1 aliphatic sulfonate ABC transporter substrate-binding protein [Pseudomonas alliivorans]MEE4620144.1 aliphatic sulfonate ABC transporter substrate-binding protein [Pseudomonas alliivorans]MEE4665329.1 aliphatic sulfonate ABC transporter substrate-binding protein [Pseudomonas alliivorans]MEE4686297.1 aliphatic sulfonate ABC transporter substrate-binding protein [Pseudomonas alliivorans]MEE46909